MIIWGGADASGDVNSGGRYTPSTDSWTATSMTNAAAARELHAAGRTGSEMIVWGGRTPGTQINTGGRNNLSTDSWEARTPTHAADARYRPTVVWSGSEVNQSGDFS